MSCPNGGRAVHEPQGVFSCLAQFRVGAVKASGGGPKHPNLPTFMDLRSFWSSQAYYSTGPTRAELPEPENSHNVSGDQVRSGQCAGRADLVSSALPCFGHGIIRWLRLKLLKASCPQLTNQKRQGGLVVVDDSREDVRKRPACEVLATQNWIQLAKFFNSLMPRYSKQVTLPLTASRQAIRGSFIRVVRGLNPRNAFGPPEPP